MNILKSNTCYICSSPANSNQQGDTFHYTCKRCGNYIVSKTEPPSFEETLRPAISGYVYEHQSPREPFHLTPVAITTIQKMSPISLEEKIHKLMRWIERKTEYPGHTIRQIYDYPEIISTCYAKDTNEIKFFLDHLEERKLILATNDIKYDFKITVDGFRYMESLRNTINSNLCFCAMSFEKQHKYIYDEVIEPAVKRAGFDIQRVDEAPYNDGIVDKIIALIRQSKFMIADLSGNKHGVYYEAGFAKGLEKQVIYTCEDEFFSNIHFDVRHLNFLKWNKSDITDAVDKLSWRIEGTIGRGSIS